MATLTKVLKGAAAQSVLKKQARVQREAEEAALKAQREYEALIRSGAVKRGRGRPKGSRTVKQAGVGYGRPRGGNVMLMTVITSDVFNGEPVIR